ncbi:MAG: hypothetical protein RLZZ188_1553 [Verrucomicrobiota bacterium]
MTAAAQDALPSAHLIDPRALMTIGSLELRARAVVEGFWSGLHRSPYHGFSVEFTEYRQYTEGDDPRYVDWRVFARSDRYYIKRYEDETNLRVQLLADQSRSMDYGSRGFTKAVYAATLAGTLAYFLHKQGDAVGLLTFDDQVREYLPPRNRAGHLRQLMLALERPSAGRGTNPVAALGRIAALTRKRGLIVLISDFLAPLDDMERELTTLAACGHELAVFQVLDPAELELGLAGPSLVEDVETGRRLYIDPAQARTDYRRRLDAHTAALESTCRKLGSAFHRISTAEPLELALFEFLQSRLRRGRLVRRAPAGGRG